MTEQTTPLYYDYRIIDVTDTKEFESTSLYEVAAVTYDENGKVLHRQVFESFERLSDAYGFIDKMYAASLKPVLYQYKDGSYL